MSRIILTDPCRSRHRCCSGSRTPTENPLTRHQTLEEACLDDVLETFSKVWSFPAVCGWTFPPPPAQRRKFVFTRRSPVRQDIPASTSHIQPEGRFHWLLLQDVFPIQRQSPDGRRRLCRFSVRSAHWLRKHQSSRWKWASGFIPSFQHALIR